MSIAGTDDVLYLMCLMDMGAQSGTQCALHVRAHHQNFDALCELDREQFSDLVHHIGARWDAFWKFHCRHAETADLDDLRTADYYGTGYYILMIQLWRVIWRLSLTDNRYDPYIFKISPIQGNNEDTVKSRMEISSECKSEGHFSKP
jgi:hypothetical protein